MTNNQAIEALLRIRCIIHEDSLEEQALVYAIEALEGKDTDVPSNDTISRQAAIDAMANTLWHYPNECYRNLSEYEFAKGLAELGLKSVPSTQPEQRWISSDKKPLKEGSYLIWIPFAPPKHRMAVAEYCGGYWNIKTPISAWMPLPEPYKERQEE